jgi:hypothetical protein
MTKKKLLEAEVDSINAWLSCVEGSRRPFARIGSSGETLVVENFPLPDQYQPDRMNMAMIVNLFPTDPPKGLYILTEKGNQKLVSTLQEKFNVFQDHAFHGAPNIEGYEWICVGYLEGWRYNTRKPERGDNIKKMLEEFWRILEE